jgi:hypothetical protein
VPDPVTTLAMTGATTIVAAMATSTWQTARDAVVRFFRHRGGAQQHSIDSQLSGHAALVGEADDADRVRQSLVPVWQVQLESLLRQCPDAAIELESLVAQIRHDLPQREQGWTQTILARDHGQVFASMGGNVIVHRAHSPETGSGADA